ncbi:MAG: DNA topoisomerase 3 [Caloramator sp.]|nr:DNA topoisomerase 3 [Caloramator sp.]
MGKSLVIAEKPSVARDYAKALRCSEYKEGFIEGEQYIITWALGHLFTLKEPEEYDPKYKTWVFDDLPIIPNRFETKIIDNQGVKKQFEIINELMKRNDVEKIILGCDAGREGELIGRYIYENTNYKKPAYRLWLSSLTIDDIKKGFKEIKPLSFYDNLYYCAKTRNELDWIFGINLSRAYTLKKGKSILLSIGRCQTAVLAQIVKRDEEIEKFMPVTFWQINAFLSSGIVAKFQKNGETKLFDKNEAEKIINGVNKQYGIIDDIKREIKKKPHPLLFNLTNLQRTMNKKYGYSAQKTLDIMQALYEKHKILSYPRTSSRYITKSMISELPKIINNLNFGDFKDYCSYCQTLNKLPIDNRLVNDSLVSDHTAIIPTCNENMKLIYDKLNEDEKRVFDEVVYCFLSSFYSEYVYESCEIKININGNIFISRIIKEIDKGWKKVYKEKEEEKNEDEEYNTSFVELKIGDKILCNDVKIAEKKTTPPQRFTENLLLEIMENPAGLIEEEALKQAIKCHGIGTDATRAGIIELLIKRNYVKRDKKTLISTSIGRELINCIDNELLKSAELTAKWEEKLADIAEGNIRKDEFISEMIEFVKEEVNRLKNDTSGVKIEAEKNNSLGKCPLCKGEVYKNKLGYGCSNYKNGCKFFIKGEIAGKKISEAQIKKLLVKGKTDLLKEFKSKNGRSFDAYLVLNEGKVEIEFLKEKNLNNKVI